MLLILSLNIILVLEGRRLAYRDDTSLGLGKQVEAIVGCVEYLPIIESEPLVVLKSKKEEVLSKFRGALASSDSRNSVHITFGQVLGYAYVDNLDVLSSPWISISYALGSSDEGRCLYTFIVPKHKWCSEIRTKVLSDLEGHNRVLAEYGYKVSVSAMTQEGEFVDLDSLPC